MLTAASGIQKRHGVYHCQQTATNQFVYLQFANHDARLWGVDVSGRAELYSDKTFGDFSTHTVMSYVRGETYGWRQPVSHDAV